MDSNLVATGLADLTLPLPYRLSLMDHKHAHSVLVVATNQRERPNFFIRVRHQRPNGDAGPSAIMFIGVVHLR